MTFQFRILFFSSLLHGQIINYHIDHCVKIIGLYFDN